MIMLINVIYVLNKEMIIVGIVMMDGQNHIVVIPSIINVILLHIVVHIYQLLNHIT